MSKLCLHHQRQIVDALGFLQTEVQAVASSCSPLSSGAKETLEAGLKTISCPEERAELPAPGQSSTPPPSKGNQSTEGTGLANYSCLIPEQSAEAADPVDAPAGSPCPTRSDLRHLWGASSVEPRGLMGSLLANDIERENQCCGSLAPAMKENSNTSNLIEVKNLPGTPKSPGHPAVGALEELQYNTKTFSPPNIADPGLVGLKSSSTKHDLVPDPFLPGQKNTLENTKDSWVRPLAAKKTTKTPSPRKARKSRNGSSPQPKDSVCRTISDPDSHYDIVYISKPITECERKPQNRMFPRRNARKSTRGHMYIKECWELKTVRTLARNSGGGAEGNCPAPMPQTIAPVTPKQALSKPDGVPSLDIPFALGCEEAVGQQGPLEDSVVEEVVEAFRVPDSKVETSQTGLPHTTKQASPPHEVLVPLVELQHKESEEVEGSRLVKEALSKNVAKPSLPEGDGEEANPGRESEKEIIATVQPRDVLPDVTVATVGKSKREAVLAEDDQNDAYENQPRLKSPSLVTAAEDFVLSENVAVVSESRKDDRPLECPMMEDVLGSAGIETNLACKDRLEKEMIEKMEAQRTDPGCQATADNEVSQTMEADLSVKEAAQPSSTDSNLEHAEIERMQEEAVVSTPGSISTKKRSSGDLVVSDRCLRSRAQPSPSEPVRLPKTFRKLPDSLAVSDVQVNGMESSVPKHSHGLDQVDKAGAAGPLAEFDPNGFTDKPQLFPDARPTGSGAESMVQTRQKHKSTMAKDLEKAVGLLGDCEGFPCTAGTASERDKLKIRKSPHEQRAILPKREKAKAANGASSTSRGIAMETSRKMPVRRDGRNVGTGAKPMSSSALMRHKKLVLRSQRPTTHKRHGQNRVDCRRKGAAERCERESDPLGLPKLDVLGPKPPKFLQALKGEENQQLITNLNNRYDKMQKGWIPLDKAGQPIQRSKNKADRLKEIWKSKRRVRKPRSLDQQKYSPVHMLFMKTFDLTSICHWFLQTTETKSLVIVKKVNTRLPSETQLCFRGPSGVGGSSHGVFPSLQAERLKKHLKKFAIASPVKSNPKNQRLIAKAWAQEGSCSKGKDKEKALTTATRISTKPYGHPHEPQPQPGESQKAAGSTKMPATARILRKYSNIREKLQVQQRTLKPKEASRADLRAKPLTSTRPISRPKSSSELREKTSPSGKSSGAKRLKTQPNPSSKRVAVRTSAKEKRKVNGSRKPSAVLNKKDPLPKRSSPSTSSLKRPKAAAAASSRCLAAPSSLKSRAETRPKESKKVATEEAVPVQPREAEEQLKKSAVRSKAAESEASQLHKVDVMPSVSQDQVLTRSQRKIEASSVTVSTLATVASKSTAKRSLDLIQTPAKRTRASFLK